MNVLIVSDNFIKVSDNKCYCEANYYQILKRFSYLGKLRICAQEYKGTSSAPIETELNFIKPSEVTYLNHFRLYCDQKNRKIIENEVLKSDLVIGYVPCITAEEAIILSKKHNKKSLSYVVACIWDGLWNRNLAGKVCATYRFRRLKSVVKMSDYALYVTNQFLQKRYPNNGINVGCSDVIIQEDLEDVLCKRVQHIQTNDYKTRINITTVAAVNVRYKGHEFVIKALAQLKSNGCKRFHYYMIGGGNKDFLTGLIKKYDVSDLVHFVGSLPHKDIFNKLDEMDVYIQPSLQEGLPRSVVEAMSRAMPCIGFRTAAIPELLDEEFVLERKSVSGIISCLMKLTPEKMIEQSKRNFAESRNYLERKLKERRNKFFDEILKDMKDISSSK